jgi:hypothetical protein
MRGRPAFLDSCKSAYSPKMRVSMRVLRVLLLLLVATAILSLTMALSTADTGIAEKVVLVGLIAVCVYLAARVPVFVARLQARLQRS